MNIDTAFPQKRKVCENFDSEKLKNISISIIFTTNCCKYKV